MLAARSLVMKVTTESWLDTLDRGLGGSPGEYQIVRPCPATAIQVNQL